MERKTKRVAGVDCGPDCFAYIGDAGNTSTWKICLRVLGDELKTRNAIGNALGRFDEVNVPDHLRQRLYDMVYGAALSRGIPADRRTFAANGPVPTPVAAEPIPAAEPVPQPTPEPEARPLSARELRELKEIHAMADARADEILAAMGLD